MKKNILINPGLKKIKSRYAYSTLSNLIVRNLKYHTNSYNFIILIEKNKKNQNYIRKNKNEYIKYILIKTLDNKILNYLKLLFIINYTAIKFKIDLICSLSNYGLIFSFKPQLVYIHDYGSFIFNSKLDNRNKIPRFFTNLIQSISVRKSEYLIFNSKFISKFFLKKFKFKGFKNYNIVGCTYKNFYSKKFKKEDSILFVGGFFGLKNHDFLINHFNNLNNNFKLFIAGVDYDKDYYNFCKKITQDNNRIKIFKNPTDEKLKELYNKSKFYISPSLFEGFSITPLEALSANCKIILSDIEAHKEIYGNQINYFKTSNLISLKRVFDMSKSNEYKKKCADLYNKKLKHEFSEKNFINKIIISFDNYFKNYVL